MLFYLCGVVLASAVIAGGGTHNGFLGDVAIQLLAIPLLCMALWPAFSAANPHRKRAQLALALCGIAAFTAAIELLPLPFAYWSGSAALPAADAAGTRTISLTPAASWAAALSLIVPLSIFASAIQLRFRQRLNLAFLLARPWSRIAGAGLPASGTRAGKRLTLLCDHQSNRSRWLFCKPEPFCGAFERDAGIGRRLALDRRRCIA